MKIQNPHDKFFKEMLGDVATATDFLTHYLPQAVLQHIDLTSLEPQKDSFVNEELDEFFSGLLFKGNIEGNDGYLYFLFEHKSYRDKGITLQLLKYMVGIWEAKMKKEGENEFPVILPLVIYHGVQDWGIPSDLGGIIKGYDALPHTLKTFVPNFEYLLFDLSTYSDKEIKGKVQTKILMLLLRDVLIKDSNRLMQSIVNSIHYLAELEDKQTGVAYFETMMRYIASAGKSLTKEDVEQIIHEVETNYSEGSEVAMTLADMWREEGREEGRQEGIALALSAMAIQLLAKKFGEVPRDIQESIQKLDTSTLENLLENIFNYEKMEDVRRYL